MLPSLLRRLRLRLYEMLTKTIRTTQTAKGTAHFVPASSNEWERDNHRIGSQHIVRDVMRGQACSAARAHALLLSLAGEGSLRASINEVPRAHDGGAGGLGLLPSAMRRP